MMPYFVVDNIDEFIHVGERKWDVIGYDGDSIYDIEGHFQMLPSQLLYELILIFGNKEMMLLHLFSKHPRMT
jgi:hypothetical protein